MRELGIYGHFIDIALDQLSQLQKAQEKDKDRILREWGESKNLPRKTKKRKRYQLQVEWSIAAYDPFGMNDIDLSMISDIFRGM